MRETFYNVAKTVADTKIEVGMPVFAISRAILYICAAVVMYMGLTLTPYTITNWLMILGAAYVFATAHKPR